MIEISHKQAQRLLRAQMDGQLPNEQWTTLQAHLETCTDCRAYGERLNGIEKSLRRSLRMGWESMPRLDVDLSSVVLDRLQSRVRNRKRKLLAGAVAAVLIVVILLGGPAGIAARLAGPPIAVTGEATPAAQALVTAQATAGGATPMPTAEAGMFPDVVAYQGRRDGQPNGDSEIYVINPGSQPVDLTNNPAQDTDPSWSPDGEWLAFLSDRDKKVEVYVTNITGSRVVQLTNAPGITWQGPLSWSPDGQWIALSGIRDDQGGQHWVYQVALDGSGPRALAGSRGGENPKYASTGGRLAFTYSDGMHQGVIVTKLQTGEQVTATWEKNQLVPPPALGSAFDWSRDGAGLAYVAADANPVASTNSRSAEAPAPSGEPGSQVVAVRNLNDTFSLFDDASHSFQIASSRWPGAFRGVTWTPGGAVVYLEDLGDARANDKPSIKPGGCWTVQVSFAGYRGQSPDNNSNSAGGQNTGRLSSFGGLCVEGGLDSASWTPDGRWVVVQGRLPSETQYSVFALRMPGGIGRNGFRSRGQATPAPGQTPNAQSDAAPGTILRLTADPWAGPLPSPRPRPSAFGQPININPQPVKPVSQNAQPSDLSQRSGGPQGQILYEVQNNSMSVVVSANPDGTGGKVLLATGAENRCPTWSPDRGQVAVLQYNVLATSGSSGNSQNGQPTATPESSSGSAENPVGAQSILVMDENGGHLHEVTRTETIPARALLTDQLSYTCPVWSPSGDAVATLVNTGREAFLAVLPVSGPTSVPPSSPNLPGNANPAPAQPRYIAIDTPDWTTNPVWAQDGRTIYLLSSMFSGAQPSLIEVAVPGDPQAVLTTSSMDLPASVRPPTAPALAVEPDGKSLAELEMIGPASTAHLHSIYLWKTDPSQGVGPAVYLLPQGQSAEDQLSQIKSGSVTWLYGDMFGIVLHGGAQGRYQTMFYLFDLASNSAHLLAQTEDAVSDAAWSPDGRWVVYSAESGLWGLDILSALRRQATPVWLSPQPVQDMDWK